MMLLCFFGFTPAEASLPIHFGLSGDYSTTSFTNTRGSGTLYFEGLLFGAGIHLLSNVDPKKDPLYADLYADYTMGTQVNSSSTLEEFKIKRFGGGIDVGSGLVFLGIHVHKATSTLSAPGYNANFSHIAYGVRSGLRFFVQSQLSFLLGLNYSRGTSAYTASANQGTRTIQELGVFMGLTFLISGGGIAGQKP